MFERVGANDPTEMLAEISPQKGIKTMKWKYYIPHVWKTPDDRASWEDVFLMPHSKQKRRSVWLEVTALGEEPQKKDKEDFEDYQDSLKKLGDQDYYLNKKTCCMLVRAVDFNMRELLEYTKIFLKIMFKDKKVVLEESDYKDFQGTHDHLGFLDDILTVASGEMPDENKEKKSKRDH